MSQLDEIEARADLAQSAWEAYQLGGSEVRIINRANDSAEDVPRLVAALRAVEKLCAETDEHPGRLNGIVSTDLIRVLIREALG